MKRSLLPLTALRAFEAAGRQQSFKRGAEELHVSEAAVSRQVRDLEKSLGVPLFRREHRAVFLTRRGRELLSKLTASFDGLDAAISAARGTTPEVISVSAEPTFANLFLIPQLGSFSALHPTLQVTIESNSELVDLRDPEGPTLAIRYSLTRSSWPGVRAAHLMEDWLTPMVSPDLATALTEPRDLLGIKLLKDETGDAWTRWLTAASIEGEPDWGPTFSNAASAMQAAEFGQGAVLLNRQLCNHLVGSTRLVAPFDRAIPNGAYWLLIAELTELSSAEIAFSNWLTASIAATNPQQLDKLPFTESGASQSAL